MKTGRVVEVLPNRQYQIRMDGSGRLGLRNRRFLKPIHVELEKSEKVLPPTLPIPSAFSEENFQEHNIDNDSTSTESQPPEGEGTSPSRSTEIPEDKQTSQKIRHPNILKSIRNFNKPGHSEERSTPKARLRGGKDY